MSGGEHRAGFVAVAGRPNAGKSTLVNALVGEKVAITAPQPQTTRTSVQGVLTMPQAQIVFVDTPGIHRSDSLFNKRMMETVRAAVDGRDLVLFVADASGEFKAEDQLALDALPKGEPALLVLNKVDLVADKRKLLPLMERYSALFQFAEILPVSARKGDGLTDLRRAIVQHLPVSPPLYPEDYLTDQPVRFLAAEILRERILYAVREEVPHAVAILIDDWDEQPAITRIAATIHVEKAGQKTILIGQGGKMLKRIGSEARVEIEKLLDRKVFLSLFVKVRAKWREDAEFLAQIDWRSMLGDESG